MRLDHLLSIFCLWQKIEGPERICISEGLPQDIICGGIKSMNPCTIHGHKLKFIYAKILTEITSSRISRFEFFPLISLKYFSGNQGHHFIKFNLEK